MALGPAQGVCDERPSGPCYPRPALDGILSAHRGYERGLRVPGAGAGREGGYALRKEDMQAGPHAEPYGLLSFERIRVSVRGPMWE